MTGSPSPDRDALEASIDRALRELTAVEGREDASRARLLARLEATDEPSGRGRRTLGMPISWAWAPAGAAIVLLVVAVTLWLARDTTPEAPRRAGTSEVAAPAGRMRPPDVTTPSTAGRTPSSRTPVDGSGTHVEQRRARRERAVRATDVRWRRETPVQEIDETAEDAVTPVPPLEIPAMAAPVQIDVAQIQLATLETDEIEVQPIPLASFDAPSSPALPRH